MKMQPGRESAVSQARPAQGKRRAYNKAMQSKTAALLGIAAAKPGSLQPTSSQPAAAACPPETVVIDVSCVLNSWCFMFVILVNVSCVQPQTIESDEEENSFDKNDDMSEDDVFVDGHIDISDDGNYVDNDGGVSQRGKKRHKGMKVGPKVIVQPSGKSKSKVWDHFDKVPQPPKEDPSVEVLVAQWKYCTILRVHADVGIKRVQDGVGRGRSFFDGGGRC
jgi:hypothetical protein